MDFINSSSINQIVLANEQITNKSGEPFGLDFPDKLEAILLEMDSFDSILDNKERIIKKASTLIAGIVFDQPFKNGNKRTALAVGILLIRNSGFSFFYGDKLQQKEIFDLLEKTMLRFEDERRIAYDEIENLLRTRIT